LKGIHLHRREGDASPYLTWKKPREEKDRVEKRSKKCRRRFFFPPRMVKSVEARRGESESFLFAERSPPPVGQRGNSLSELNSEKPRRDFREKKSQVYQAEKRKKGNGKSLAGKR